jgi:hypothetical protein
MKRRWLIKMPDWSKTIASLRLLRFFNAAARENTRGP